MKKRVHHRTNWITGPEKKISDKKNKKQEMPKRELRRRPLLKLQQRLPKRPESVMRTSRLVLFSKASKDHLLTQK